MSRAIVAAILLASLATVAVPPASAHGVADSDRAFLESNPGTHVGPFMYLGAKHMVTGYDHLLFLAGVIFFLHRMRDVVTYVSLFTLGHSLTLVVGVLGDIRANAFVIDAIIGVSVVYKAFDNMEGFRLFGGRRPDPKAMVALFGLIHGFGLATKLQEFALSSEGLVANILSFNVGVEIGQFLALALILLAFTFWRRSEAFARHAFAANVLIMLGGFLLVGYQVGGFFWGA